MSHEGAGAGQTHGGAAEDAGELELGHGEVGAHHDHDGADIVLPRHGRSFGLLHADEIHHSLPHGKAVDPQILHAPEVGLHQNAQSEATLPDLHDAGGRADAPLQPEADGALARAHVALGKVLAGGSDGGIQVGLIGGAVIVAGQDAVVGLSHHGVDGSAGSPLGGALLDGIAHEGVVDLAHVEGPRQGDGGLQGSQLLHLHEARCFAEAVDDVAGGGDGAGEEVPLGGEDDGDSRLLAVGVDGRVTDADARDVGDLIELARGQTAYGDAVVADAGGVHDRPPVR